MKISSSPVLIAVVCVVLAGCDRCTKKEEAPSATATDQATPADAAATATPPAPAPTPDPATSATPAPEAAPAEGATASDDTKQVSGDGKMKVTDVKIGKGAVAKEGKKVSVLYTGTLQNGTKFDSTKDRNTPFSFVLGSGMVIAGWDQGVKGMKEGGTRKLVIPPNLAYGNRSVGGVIPPNSTLIFEIELVKVE